MGRHLEVITSTCGCGSSELRDCGSELFSRGTLSMSAFAVVSAVTLLAGACGGTVEGSPGGDGTGNGMGGTTGGTGGILQSSDGVGGAVGGARASGGNIALPPDSGGVNQQDSALSGSGGISGGGSSGAEADASVVDAGMTPCDLSGAGKMRRTIAATGAQTLTSDIVWTLEGEVHIADGQTLTIEPCTRIEGTKVPVGLLVISRGGRIVANGTPEAPIVFTSQLPAGSRAGGDWGGIFLLGRAPTFLGSEGLIEGLSNLPENRYGGNAPDDDSGEMRYVLIEFAGMEIPIEPNAFTMAGVGRGTVIENIMVNTTLDDCFEWFGGTVNATNLICNNGGDDMFDADQGYNGTIHTVFGRMVTTSSSNPSGLEMESSPTNLTPVTNVTLRNATLCGLGVAGIATTTHGLVLRENLTGAFDNVVTTFFDVGVDVRDSFGTPASPNVTLVNSVFFGNTVNVGNTAETDDDFGFDEYAWFAMGMGNTTDDPGYTAADCQNVTGPTAAVTGSGVGAFADGATWMEGQWVSWKLSEFLNPAAQSALTARSGTSTPLDSA